MNTRNRLLVNLRLIVPSSAFCSIAAVCGLPQVAALLHLHPVLRAAITMGAFWTGVFITCGQAWSAEMKFGTLPTLLVQPVARYQLWKEKALATAVAISPLVVLHVAGIGGLESKPPFYLLFALVWAATVVLSAMPLGFLMKSGSQVALHILVTLGVPAAILVRWTRPAVSQGELALLIGLGVVALSAHALSAVIRARRTLGLAEIAILPQWDPQFVAPSWDRLEQKLGLLRPARTKPIRNFVLKELRILSLFWFGVLLASAVLIGLIPLRVMEWSRSEGWVGVTFAMILLLAFGSVILPGIAYAGERLVGVHTLHMTLPMSSRKIWLLRALTLALSVAIAMGWTLALTGVFFGIPLDNGGMSSAVGPRMIALPILISVFSLFSVCCSTVGGGKEEALAATVAVPSFAMVAWLMGGLLQIELVGRGWLDRVLEFVHPYPFSGAVRDLLMHPATGPLLSGVVLLLFLAGALVKSYRTFSLEPPAGFKPIRRYVAVAVGFAFVSGFSWRGPRTISTSNRYSTESVFRETVSRIRTLGIDTGKVRTEQPLVLSAADLEKASPPSSVSRRWLSSRAVILTVPRIESINGFRIEYDLQLNFTGGRTCTAPIVGGLLFAKSCDSVQDGNSGP